MLGTSVSLGHVSGQEAPPLQGLAQRVYDPGQGWSTHAEGVGLGAGAARVFVVAQGHVDVGGQGQKQGQEPRAALCDGEDLVHTGYGKTHPSSVVGIHDLLVVALCIIQPL